MKLTHEKSERSYYINSGAFTIVRLSVKFYGHIFFVNNSFSALALISTRAEFKDNVHISFRNNTGFTGGVILMYGISVLFTASSTYFEFIGNEALVDGGAIIYTTGQFNHWNSFMDVLVFYNTKVLKKMYSSVISLLLSSITQRNTVVAQSTHQPSMAVSTTT